MRGHVVIVRADENWHGPLSANASDAERMIKEFQTQTFQSDAEVLTRAATWLGGRRPKVTRVPGGHFGMLHEAHAPTVALQVCRALAEAEEE